jgi:hypothetical protein
MSFTADDLRGIGEFFLQRNTNSLLRVPQNWSLQLRSHTTAHPPPHTTHKRTDIGAGSSTYDTFLSTGGTMISGNKERTGTSRCCTPQTPSAQIAGHDRARELTLSTVLFGATTLTMPP